jgi:transcription antitermination factor NusG
LQEKCIPLGGCRAGNNIVSKFKKLLGEGVVSKYEFSKGESVRIKVGAFRAFIGKISEIDKAKGTLKVIVEVFGKSQSVKLNFLDVEKVADYE